MSVDRDTGRSIDLQRDYFEGRAPGFDRGHLGTRENRCHLAKITRILKYLDLAPGDSVLEVGVGTGIHAGWLLERCTVEYVGVDLSPAMLEVARHRLGDRIELVEAAAEDLPLDDGRFDAAFCSGTLHHVADKALALAEMRRVLKPGGRLVVAEPNPWNPVNASAWMRNPLERGQLDMRPARLAGWLARAGCRVEHVELFNFTPPFPRFLARPFDVVDSLASRLPIVRGIASMLLVAATAAGPATTRHEPA